MRMGFSWVSLLCVCCVLRATCAESADGTKQRKPFFERFRRLEEQFRRFQELSLARLQIISENFNASSTVDLRLEMLAQQYINITATVHDYQATTSHDIASLRSWVKKLLKENKKIDLKMSTLEKVASERSKRAWREKQQQSEVAASLSSQVEEQMQQINALTAGKKRLHKAMDRMQEDIKGQHVQIARFQQQMKSALQNDALSLKPTSPDRDPPAAPRLQRAKVLNQSPSGEQRSPAKEGSSMYPLYHYY
ncbi:pentraxin-4-like [Rhinoraja longicauda]